MSTITNDALASNIASKLGDLNQQMVEANRDAAKMYLDAYESAVDSFATYHEQAASQTDIEWITSAAKAQAEIMRETAARYVALGRQLLKDD